MHVENNKILQPGIKKETKDIIKIFFELQLLDYCKNKQI